MTTDTMKMRIELEGGVFADPDVALIRARLRDDPPPLLDVYLCPCCSLLIAYEVGDPRGKKLGRDAATYVLRPGPIDRERAVYVPA